MKKTLIIIAAVIAVIAAGFGVRAYIASKATVIKTVQAKRGPVTQIVSETGNVVASDDLTLSFKNSGRVDKIMVKEGDRVTAGQAVMRLDTSSLAIQRREAAASMATSQARYDQALAGATDSQINIARTSVNNAQTGLDSATQALADLKTSDGNALNQAYADQKGALESLYVQAGATMQTLRKDMFDAQGNLSQTIRSTDYASLTAALSGFTAAQASSARMDSDIVLYRNAANHADADTLAAEMLGDGKVIRDATNAATLLLQTSIPAGISQADLDARKADVKAAWAACGAAVSGAEASSAALKSLKSNQASAENATYNNVQAAQGALNSANDQLRQMTAPLRDVDKAIYRTAVDSARASVQLIDQQISDATLTAPVDGIVGSIDISLGEIAAPNAPVGTLVSAQLQIESEVSELDIASLQAGQSVDIAFDAIVGQVFKGHVFFVAPRETTKNEDIYYKIKIAIDQGSDAIRIGMTANLDITTGHKDDALLVPRRQVYSSGGNDYVKIVPPGGSPVETQVAVGLRGLDDYEILSGVKEGDAILVE